MRVKFLRIGAVSGGYILNSGETTIQDVFILLIFQTASSLFFILISSLKISGIPAYTTLRGCHLNLSFYKPPSPF